MLPLIVEPGELHAALAQKKYLLVDLSAAEKYREGHIPGAVHLDMALLTSGEKPAPGKLPALSKLAEVLAGIGIAPDTHVVCYDDEGGLCAARLIWTLDVVGHAHSTFLNGGKTAWVAEGLPLETSPNTTPLPCAPQVLTLNKHLLMTAADIQAHLADDDFLVWDARSREEYTGEKIVSARGGHIPGAVHCEWKELLDNMRAMRFRSDLAEYLRQKGITQDKNIVTHCQTHRRSALTYLAAKSLGYPRIAAYPGSWSEWGNAENLPIHTGVNP